MLFQMVEGKTIEDRLNYGTIFRPTPDLYTTSEFWRHTFIVDLKLDSFEDDQLPKCQTECPEIEYVTKHLSSIHNETYLCIQTITNNILRMVPTMKNLPSRNKRSLLPFVGKIASGLFGLATSSDVRKIANNLNALHKNSNKLDVIFQHQTDRMSSFMATSNERLTNAFKGIQDNHDMITQMEHNFKTFAETFDEKQSWLFAKVIDQSYNYNYVRESFQNIFLGFIALLQGQISPLLIDNSEFTKALQLIQYSINKNRPSFKLLHKNPSFYYNHADFSLHKSDHALLITVKFPHFIIVSTLQNVRDNSLSSPYQ